MNQTDCPPGYATDSVLVYSNTLNKCETPMAAWLGSTITIIVLRSIVTCGQIHLWYSRESHRKDRKSTNYREGIDYIGGTRLPIIPTLSASVTISFTICVVLATLNIANYANGFSLFLFGWVVLFAGISHIFFVVKFVRLSDKLLGKFARKAIGNVEILTRFDTKGRIILIICWFFWVVMSTLSIIVSPIIPGR